MVICLCRDLDNTLDSGWTLKLSNSDDPLEKLHSLLAECAKQYMNEDLPTQRLAVLNALYGVAKFLEASGFSPDTLLPILRPAVALVAREGNARDQMFAQRSRKGRPNKTNDEHLRDGIFAGFANAWLKLHQQDDLDQSAKLAEAARRMRGKWFKTVTRANLETARAIVSEEPEAHLAVETAKWFEVFFDRTQAIVGSEKVFSLMVRYFNEHPVGDVMGICKTPPVSPTDQG